MELTPKQQALELISKSKHILIAPGRADGDSIGSGLALHLVLSRLGKQSSLVVLDPLPDKFNFLPQLEEVQQQFNGLRDFVISLNCTSASADKLAYNFQDDKLNIVITPKLGAFKSTDVSFAEGNFQYDCLITLDAADLEQVGPLYTNNPKLFQNVPIINIDHHASNDYYGAVNLVDLTATSTAEILVGLIEALGPSLIDANVATALLTGIINDTGSFQHSNTTPKSLTIAAQMVGFGARHQEIIQHLFKTKAFSTLKLWGRILTNVRHEPESRLVWSSTSLSDLSETEATGDQISGIIDELMTSVPEADIVVLLSERDSKVISGSIRTKRGIDAADIAKMFGGGGHHGAAGFKLLDSGIPEAETTVVTKIREYQAKRSSGVAQLSAEPENNSPEAPISSLAKSE
ncbi:DHH family phosphoesterase [Patescibacteria group bacterium]|nr:DHH family phosphoesterase [Patescibacteria group bacterium]